MTYHRVKSYSRVKYVSTKTTTRRPNKDQTLGMFLLYKYLLPGYGNRPTVSTETSVSLNLNVG